MRQLAIELYKGRDYYRPFSLASEAGDIPGAVRLRVWRIEDEAAIALDPNAYGWPIDKQLPTPDAETGDSAIVISSAESANLSPGTPYRFRVEAIGGADTTPVIGGRLYVGAAYGQ